MGGEFIGNMVGYLAVMLRLFSYAEGYLELMWRQFSNVGNVCIYVTFSEALVVIMFYL